MDEGSRFPRPLCFLSDFGFVLALLGVKEREVRYEQELSDNSDNCGAGPHDWVRHGGYLGQRMLHQRSALHGLRRHEGGCPYLWDDHLHPLRRHGHRAARERDGHCGEYGHLRYVETGDRASSSASTPAAWTQSPSAAVRSPEYAASASWRGNSASPAERPSGRIAPGTASGCASRGSSSRRRWQAGWRRPWRPEVSV